LRKGYSITDSLLKINRQYQLLKITKNRHNCQQFETRLKIFLLSHFEYSQIWLNRLMDDRHLLNITKWKLSLNNNNNNNKRKSGVWQVPLKYQIINYK
jgi:hypothetical protein